MKAVNEPVEERNFDGEGTLEIDMGMVNAKPGTVAELLEKVDRVLDPHCYDDDQVWSDSLKATEFTHGEMRALRNILGAIQWTINFDRRELVESRGLKLVKLRRAAKGA